MKEYKVKEVAEILNKHEETIKRWLRSGKFPNAYRNSDKEGWRITESDLLVLNKIPVRETALPSNNLILEADELELIELAYQTVTLTSPTDKILSILSVVGIKRTLEILLIMQQSPTKVKNPDGFIKKAIRENWSPSSTSTKLPSKKMADFSQKKFENSARINDEQSTISPFYNWLEEN